MFVCQMPYCRYMCENRSQICEHHIVPKSMGGSDKRNNIITLCPNCHAKVFVPGAIHGIHSIKSGNSIILIRKLMSTVGTIIEYKNINNDDLKYYTLKG